MARVVLCPFTRNTWGHLVRTLAVADALASRGHVPTIAAHPAAAAMVLQAGLAFVELDSLDDQRMIMPGARARAARRWFDRKLAEARACVTGADAVVVDLEPIVAIAAALEAVPCVSILNLELLGTPLSWWVPGLARSTAHLPAWARERIFGDVLLVGDTPEATGLRDLAPEHAAWLTRSVGDVRFVGPILGPLPRWRRTHRARSRVLISLGADGGRGILGGVLAGLAGVEADVTVVTGAATPTIEADLARLRSAGGVVDTVGFIADFASALLDVDALVTHGGHGTLMQAIMMGVPTLVVPYTLERELNARRLRQLGEVTAPNLAQVRDTIGAQLAHLLRDHPRDAARAAEAERLSSYGGAGAAALAIEQLLARS